MSRPSVSESESAGNAILEDRQAHILRLLAEQGSVRVGELSRQFGVSQVTIRTDLQRLAREGLLVRYRGGAVARVQTNMSVAFGERSRFRQSEKERIAQKAAGLINAGDAILLDAGTTVMELAKRLEGCSPLTVVTNALNTAVVLSGLSGINVIIAGGSVSVETVSTVGHIAERDIGDLVVDKLFLGAHCFDPELGMMDVSVEVARVKRAMIQAARQVIVLADSTKFGKRALAKVAPLSAANSLITDDGLSQHDSERIAALGVEVVRV